MAGGRLVQTRGPATANALSPSDVIVRGMPGNIAHYSDSHHLDEYFSTNNELILQVIRTNAFTILENAVFGAKGKGGII